MFWIMGGEHLVISLHKASESQGFLATVADQMDHVAWDGFHFYDLIFPLFVFLMGVSTVFSLTKVRESQGKRAAYGRVIRRFVLLYLLGLFYHGGMSRDGGPEMFRYMGVLHRIAICYLFGGLLFINFRLRGLMTAAVLLLVGYWAMMTFIPVPGGVAGDYAEGANLANYVDAQYLPGYKWDGEWDPEGILSTIPAIASGLLGIFAGLLIRREDLKGQQKVVRLVAAGLVCLLLGWGWGLQFPIIKKLWTSSFVLYAGGWSYLLVALFYLLIDVWKIGLWHRPFVWIGMNCITVYMVSNLVGGYRRLIRRVVHQPMVDGLGAWGDLGVTILGLLLVFLFCHYLYKRQIFLRV
jgi:predicted acyltransferase